jgi:hypothetical protein
MRRGNSYVWSIQGMIANLIAERQSQKRTYRTSERVLSNAHLFVLETSDVVRRLTRKFFRMTDGDLDPWNLASHGAHDLLVKVLVDSAKFEREMTVLFVHLGGNGDLWIEV